MLSYVLEGVSIQPRPQRTPFPFPVVSGPGDLDDEKPAGPAAGALVLPDPRPSRLDFEFLSHTADIQLHAWAPSFSSALELTALAMVAYMTDLSKVEVDRERPTRSVRIKASDLQSVVFNFLSDLLFVFSSDNFVWKDVRIWRFEQVPTASKTDMQYVVEATLFGEPFDMEKHSQGTEVKAITYSNMQILEKEGQCDIYVIVDI